MAERAAHGPNSPTIKTYLNRYQPASTEVHYAEEVRFQKPTPPKFGLLPAALSVLSLLAMTIVAAVLLSQLRDPETAVNWLPSFFAPPKTVLGLAAWTWIPLLFTMIGAGLGLVFELGLILSGIAFQTRRNKFTSFVSQLRLLNLAPVLGSTLFFVACISLADADARFLVLCLVGGVFASLGFALLFGGSEPKVGAILFGVQAVQILLVWNSPMPGDSSTVAYFLVAQAGLQIVALVMGTATPLRSTGFHVISTISVMMLYGAIRTATDTDSGFSDQVAIDLPWGSPGLWVFAGSILFGLALTPRLLPKSYARFRSMLSDAVWSIPIFLLVSNPRFPDPIRLGEVYGGEKPKPIGVKPYYQVHPEFLVQSLSVPEAMRLPETIKVFARLVKLVKFIFKLIAPLDHFFPQADVLVPIGNKPRMKVWSDGDDYWPTLFRRNLLGRTVPGEGEMERTPEPAIEAYKAGQLLAYLTESGIGSTLVRLAEEADAPAPLVLDFTFLEKYETKEDYDSYGGKAYLRIDEDAERLELVAVVAPHTSEVIGADPHNPTFRYAESLVTASLYYHVISGKHLVEIHMTYALVEIMLHNAFDAHGQWTHPFRTFMYLHLFSHGLAEMLTTKHLVQGNAVFAQVFATSQDGLIGHLNDTYSAFEYGDDEDFNARTELMTTKNGKVLPNAAIAWEVKYGEMFQRYTDSLIDIIYADDEAVRADECLQEFHNDLCSVLQNPLPERYAKFATKSGVARYAADTIHHLIIRHQVYGTTSVKAALDPRISKTQVPRDTGTTPVDEWRSLVNVALATARERFTLLMRDYKYLLEDVDAKYRKPMGQVFDQLQADLRSLEDEWTRTAADRQFNYDYFRPLPSALHTGAGY